MRCFLSMSYIPEEPKKERRDCNHSDIVLNSSETNFSIQLCSPILFLGILASIHVHERLKSVPSPSIHSNERWALLVEIQNFSTFDFCCQNRVEERHNLRWKSSWRFCSHDSSEPPPTFFSVQ